MLQYVGFTVSRVAAWVLLGNKFQPGMPLNHNVLLVQLQDGTAYLCDPGLAAASPRFPLGFSMNR